MKEIEYQIIQPTASQEELVAAAVELVNHFYAQGLMLPVKEEEWVKLADQSRLVVAVAEEQVIGTAGLTVEYEEGLLEFGGWAVDEEWQGAGVGKALLITLLEVTAPEKLIAFGNSNSEPIIKALGGVEVEDVSKLPEAIFEPCQKCPNKPEGGGCCDTILDLAPIVINLLAVEG